MATKNFYTIDQYDKLFTKCDGVTTSFVDSATVGQVAKTITANGNATQLSMPTGMSNTAMFFNGTSDYVVVPNSADFNFGTGNLSIEGYFFWNSVSGVQELWNFGDYSSPVCRLQGMNSGHFYASLAGSTVIDYVWTPTVNTWYKIKFERLGTGAGQCHLYVNDVDVAQGTSNGNVQTGSTVNTIGSYQGGGQYFNGWMKNLVVTKSGTTVLDMRGNTPATSPLGPAIAFDGTGDYLSVADHADFDLDAFTQEGWFYFTTVSSPQGIWGANGTTENGWAILSWNNSTGAFEAKVSGTAKTDWTYALTANCWYHIALVRETTTTSLYINGQPLSGTLSDGDQLAPSNPIAIGVNDVQTLTGYAREWRISNTARYTAAFTPSQSGFTVDSNTKLYVKGNEDNGVTTFVDSETTPKTVTTAGDTKIKYIEDYRSCIFKDDSASAHKSYPQGSAKVDFFAIGSGVGYFDGTGDYLSIPDSDDWDMSGGITSMEGYFRTKSLAASQGLWGQKTDTNTYMSLRAAITTGIMSFNIVVGGVQVVNFDSSVGIQLNQWAHVALVENGDSYYLFLNGTLVGSATDTSRFGNYTGTFVIGRDDVTAGYEFNGLLDNIRISKGVARYTTTFNPPEFKLGGNQIMWII